jgi:hypothetical protein
MDYYSIIDKSVEQIGQDVTKYTFKFTIGITIIVVVTPGPSNGRLLIGRVTQFGNDDIHGITRAGNDVILLNNNTNIAKLADGRTIFLNLFATILNELANNGLTDRNDAILYGDLIDGEYVKWTALHNLMFNKD